MLSRPQKSFNYLLRGFVLSLMVFAAVTASHPATAFADTSAAAALPACPAGAVYQPYTGGNSYYSSSIGAHVTGSGQCQPSNDQLALVGGSSWFESYIWIPIMSALGSIFLMIGGAFLRMSGLLFDTVIQAIIISFGSSITTLGIMDKITMGWTLFRDLSNILLIGMFVFIAISTILGSKEYGYKRLVARVLVIAVLMNFSLLFTKIIIDASNFTAYQFYSKMAGTTVSGDTTTTNQFDVAGAFLQPMGITSVWNDSYSVTSSVGQTANSGMAAFFFGLVGGILLAIIAGVLLYGVILIATRGIMILFLMITASIAFATYLIPSFAEGQYGWRGWWKALMNCAIFAPLLMLFLSLSVIILQSANTQQGNLGSVISNPSQLVSASGGGWNIIVVYILGVGLLFVSLKVSSKFASMASGVSLASMTAGFATSGFGGLIGLAGRNTVGKYMGANRFETLQNHVADKEAAAKLRGETYHMTGSERMQLQTAKWLSTKTFDPGKTKLGGAVVKSVGGAPAANMFKDAGKGGYTGVKNRQRDNAIKKAEAIAVPAAKVEAAAKKLQPERARVEEVVKRETSVKEKAEETRKDIVNTEKQQQVQRPVLETQLKAKVAEQESNLTERKEKSDDYQTQLTAAKQRIENARDAATKRAAEQELARLQAQMQTELGAIDTRISTHETTAIKPLRDSLAKLDKDANDKADAVVNHVIAGSAERLKTANDQLKEIDDAAKKVGTSSGDTVGTAGVARDIAFNRWGTLKGRLGSIETDPVASKIKSAVQAKKDKESVQKIVKAINEEANGGHAAPPPAGAGHAPGGSHP